jgi:hypothetical protein
MKIALFALLVTGATVLFRKDSRRGLSDRWALFKCEELLAQDLAILAPFSQPKVDHCEGTPSDATCFVETTERDGRKTAPIKNWDCTKRHIRPEVFGEMARSTVYAPIPGAGFDPRRGQEMMAQFENVKTDFEESVKYVKKRMEARRELIDGK